MKKTYFILLIITGLFVFSISCRKTNVNKALIVTGQNNTDWGESTPVLKQILEQTGLFSCDIATSPAKGGDMRTFSPSFQKYKLVVLNYTGDSWSEETKSAFIDYVVNGGGIVVYHASSSAFPDWKEYHGICGLGGWGSRTHDHGVCVYYLNNQVVIDTASFPSGRPGEIKDFEIKSRNINHPVTRGLPARWMHAEDVLYSGLRGTAENLEILATAYCDTTGGGTGRDEPVLMAITYGKGRIFHTTLGYPEKGGGAAMQSVGFIATLQRGAEWAATGEVTQQVPFDFPSASGVVLRQNYETLTLENDFKNITSYEIGKSTKYITDIQSWIRDAEGDQNKLLSIEKMMVNVLRDSRATSESKRLMLRELSWMGSQYSLPVIKNMVSDPDLKEEAEFALERLNIK